MEIKNKKILIVSFRCPWPEYNKGKSSKFWLRIKKFYNSFPSTGKSIVEIFYRAIYFGINLLQFQNPLTRIKNYKSNRGMDWETDITDWLGGYPYEFAAVEEVSKFTKENFPNFNLVNIKTVSGAGAIVIYLEMNGD